jgi:competence protein ComEC
VLKVGHHGSGSSSGATFLRRIRPALAVISVGHHNRFGHPDPRALARLHDVGARVLRTDDAGAVWLEFGGDSARIVDWRRERPVVAATPVVPIRARLPGPEARW